MKIIVCMKQVPASSKVDIEPETGNLKRGSAGQRTNPYDLYALECALQIREKTRGTVTVLTMGPGQAESMIRDAYSMGTASLPVPMCWQLPMPYLRELRCWAAQI